jgi:hypothetical protein
MGWFRWHFWGRSLMVLGLSQLAETEAVTELETLILDAKHRFVDRDTQCYQRSTGA